MTHSLLTHGTTETEAPRRDLQAGLLSASFDAGSLRWIRWNGTEVLRAIMFLVRTPGWGTPAPVLRDLEIAQNADGFSVSYTAHYGARGAGVIARIRFEGTALGAVRAHADITAEAPFATNRTGFVILHPLDGFAGTQVQVDHADRTSRSLVIPARISPGQPVMDLRAIHHMPRPGLRVSTRFAGDVFEMEDHRNWSDASFKTYSRPIGLPYPYLLDPSAPVEQEIQIEIADEGQAGTVSQAFAVPAISGQTLPDYALPLDHLSDVDLALEHLPALRAVSPQLLLLRCDLTRETELQLAPLARLSAELGAGVEVILIPAASDDAGAAAEIAAFAAASDRAGLRLQAIAAFAKIDEQSFQPGQPRPPHPSQEALNRALRQHFLHSRIGGGTPAFFTEFNRKRPDPALADYLTFATTPLVHAADDASVIESLQSLPHILSSAAALAGGKPLAIGPVGIGARLNPYGPAPTDNPPERREGMAAQDPRQRGLFAAAWTVGYLTRIAPFAPQRFAFGGIGGGFGLLSLPQSYGRPFWDDLPPGAAYPLHAVARWIASAAGGSLLEAELTAATARLVWRKNGQRSALIASLDDAGADLDLPEWAGFARLLSAETVQEAARDPEGFGLPQPLGAVRHLPAFSVIYLTEGLPE